MMKSFLLLLALAGSAYSQAITARQIIARVKQHIGAPLPSNTVDTFKAGNPDTPITGVAVTMMATYDVLQRAAADHKNLVITHEPTFYNHQDATKDLQAQSDPVLKAKEEFIQKHKMVVWRFHDGWHLHKPDGILLGVTHALGWSDYQSASDSRLFTIPETSVEKLAESMDSKLSIKTSRVVGDKKMKVTKIALQPGAAGTARHIKLLERDDVEVLAIGEVPEWETIEYVSDAVSEGHKKGLILLGHIPSEQPGMQECAIWMRHFVSEVPVAFIPAREPFWNPKR